MTDRRYRDDEVRKIFGLVTDQKSPAPPVSSPVNGLTLAEMQSIGLEVGFEADAVARAAAAFDAASPHAPRTSFGAPIEVARTVPLPRALSDHEWEQLVAELRATFKAQGTISTHGALREWTNGNLHVSVEPADKGYRLRLETLKGNAVAVNALGLTALAASTVTFVTVALWGMPVSVADWLLYVAPTLMAGAGIGTLAANRSRLSRWARERAEQMAHIAEQVRSIVS